MTRGTTDEGGYQQQTDAIIASGSAVRIAHHPSRDSGLGPKDLGRRTALVGEYIGIRHIRMLRRFVKKSKRNQ